MTTTEILFALLRSELGGAKPADGVVTVADEETLETLYSVAKSHDLSHLVASALSKDHLLGTDAVSQKLQQQLMVAIYRYEKIHYEVERICSLFEENGIPHIALKGSIIRNYYPEPWMRTSCDIDILIHLSDAEKAIPLLCDVGFARLADSTTHDYSLMSPGGVHLELHYSLTQDGSLPATDSILESVWQYTTPEPDCQFRQRMTDELFLLYHIAHMAKHFINGGCGIRPLMDLWLLNRRMPLDAAVFSTMLEETRLSDFYAAAVDLSNVWFENAPHSAVTRQMEHFILTGGVYGTTANSAAVEAGKGKSKLQSFFNLMFLTRPNLEVLYPGLKQHPSLLPFYQVKRWFRIFRKDKRDKVTRLTVTRNAVSDDEVQTVAGLLTHLGLS